MEKEIKISVEKSEVKETSVFGGIQGEGGARTLKISFDDEWNDLSKKITFYDGAMQNSVSVMLTDDKKINGEYIIKIPAEPLKTGGKLTYVIDGAKEGARQRSVQRELRVKYAAPCSENSATEITPTEAEQLAQSINTLAQKAESLGESLEDTNSAVATKADKTEIPKKVSELENDSGYLTEHQSLEAYALKSAVATKADKTEIPKKVSELENDSGYLTEHQSLEAYALKSEVATKADKTDVEDLEKVVDKKASKTEVSSLDEKTDYLEKELGDVKTKLEAVSEKVFGKEPKTWEDVQSIVRAGAARQYFDIGDQFVVEKLSAVSASIGESQGITSASVDADEFINGIGEVCAGEYSFSYDGSSWRDEKGKTSVLANFGISVSGTPKVGDKIVVTETSTELTFDVIGIDHDTPADSSRKHSMTLQMHDLWTSAMIFDAPEAAWYIDAETYPQGLVAGTYHFTIPDGYDNAHGGGSTLNFTLANDVPVGGQVRFAWFYNVQANTCKISTYESVGAATAIETVTVADGEVGSAMPTLHVEATTENTNCIHRMRYGSNNWAESALRQWLNTNAEANTWWEPKTVFDRPANASTAGFLKGIDPAFLDVIGEVTKATQESISDEYGHNIANERFFLLSRPEIYAGTERSADGADGTVYPYYGAGYSDLTAPGTGADSNRIKYRSGSATYWWLRTPFSTGGGGVRGVYPTGTLNYLHALDGYGVAPACVIV